MRLGQAAERSRGCSGEQDAGDPVAAALAGGRRWPPRRPAGEGKLSAAQVAELESVLDANPTACGYEVQCGTLTRIVGVVWQRFRMDYTLAGWTYCTRSGGPCRCLRSRPSLAGPGRAVSRLALPRRLHRQPLPAGPGRGAAPRPRGMADPLRSGLRPPTRWRTAPPEREHRPALVYVDPWRKAVKAVTDKVATICREMEPPHGLLLPVRDHPRRPAHPSALRQARPANYARESPPFRIGSVGTAASRKPARGDVPIEHATPARPSMPARWLRPCRT